LCLAGDLLFSRLHKKFSPGLLGRGRFRVTVLIGILLAGLCWYVCSVCTRLWNKKYHITLTHRVLCGFATLCTLFFTILLARLPYTKGAALASISLWQAQLNSYQAWAERTFARANDKVKELGVEDFSNAPPPPRSSAALRQELSSLASDVSKSSALITAAKTFQHAVDARWDLTKQVVRFYDPETSRRLPSP